MRSQRNRLKRLEERLPKRPDPQAPLTEADIQSLNNLHRVYGDGGSPPNWRTVYPTHGDLDRKFEEALAKAYRV